MKHCVILGTRPEIIKMSSILRELEERGEDYFLIHSNQHYSKEMDAIFFEELRLPKPKYNLGVGSGTHAKQTARMLESLEDILLSEKPDVIYVQGDTNTVMAGALAASKLGIKVAHIEAGLRSYDRAMPEEINRIITDHISDYLFPPTQKAAGILLGEGIEKDKVYTVGNTIVDAVYQTVEMNAKDQETLNQFEVLSGQYFLLTLHRPSNVDNQENLKDIFKGLSLIWEKYQQPIIFPVHPRTAKQIEGFKLSLPKGVRKIEPVGFIEMLQLEKNANLILTDSGGIQEEACILHKPCVTLRENTERPETVEVGGNILAGSQAEKIVEAVDKLLNASYDWENPFGDGQSAKRIIDITTQKPNDI